MLSDYHQNYLKRSDEELQRRAKVKEMELEKIFSEIPFSTDEKIVKIAVTGCADHRFVKYHREIFEKLLKKKVDLNTFDIAVEHLKDEVGVKQHDITMPFPNSPFDIAFGHVVLKFIETEKQWQVLKNCYEALRSPGLAIHVFDLEDVETKEIKQRDGLWSVPLDRWTEQLEKENIEYKIIYWSLNLDKIEIPIRGLKGGALVLIKR
jgi:hypothetical protein